MVKTVNLRDQVYDDLTTLKGKRESYSDVVEDLIKEHKTKEKKK